MKRKIHKLKIDADYADAVLSGDKNFEVRRNDRGYQKGDHIQFLAKYRDGTANSFHDLNKREYELTYVHSGLGLDPNYVVFGIREVPRTTD